MPPSRGPFTLAFLARVAVLAQNPRVEVRALELGPPTDPAVLARIETERGLPLPTELRAFYEEVGFLRLAWRCLPEGRTHTGVPVDPPGSLWHRLPGATHGIVDVLPALETFSGDYTGDLWFPGDKHLNAITVDGRPADRRHLRRFDAIDLYTESALLVEPGRADIPVVLGFDAFAEVGPRSWTVTRYLQLLVDNVGYQGDTHDGLCEGLEASLGVRDPYEEPVYSE